MGHGLHKHMCPGSVEIFDQPFLCLTESTQANKRAKQLASDWESIKCKAVHLGVGVHRWPERLNADFHKWAFLAPQTEAPQGAPMTCLLPNEKPTKTHVKSHRSSCHLKEHRAWEARRHLWVAYLSIPQFYWRSTMLLWGLDTWYFSFDLLLSRHGHLCVSASQFFPDVSSPSFARFPGKHTWTLRLQTAVHSKPVRGHVDSLHHV